MKKVTTVENILLNSGNVFKRTDKKIKKLKSYGLFIPWLEIISGKIMAEVMYDFNSSYFDELRDIDFYFNVENFENDKMTHANKFIRGELDPSLTLKNYPDFSTFLILDPIIMFNILNKFYSKFSKEEMDKIKSLNFLDFKIIKKLSLVREYFFILFNYGTQFRENHFPDLLISGNIKVKHSVSELISNGFKDVIKLLPYANNFYSFAKQYKKLVKKFKNENNILYNIKYITSKINRLNAEDINFSLQNITNQLLFYAFRITNMDPMYLTFKIFSEGKNLTILKVIYEKIKDLDYIITGKAPFKMINYAIYLNDYFENTNYYKLLHKYKKEEILKYSFSMDYEYDEERYNEGIKHFNEEDFEILKKAIKKYFKLETENEVIYFLHDHGACYEFKINFHYYLRSNLSATNSIFMDLYHYFKFCHKEEIFEISTYYMLSFISNFKKLESSEFKILKEERGGFKNIFLGYHIYDSVLKMIVLVPFAIESILNKMIISNKINFGKIYRNLLKIAKNKKIKATYIYALEEKYDKLFKKYKNKYSSNFFENKIIYLLLAKESFDLSFKIEKSSNVMGYEKILPLSFTTSSTLLKLMYMSSEKYSLDFFIENLFFKYLFKDQLKGFNNFSYHLYNDKYEKIEKIMRSIILSFKDKNHLHGDCKISEKIRNLRLLKENDEKRNEYHFRKFINSSGEHMLSFLKILFHHNFHKRIELVNDDVELELIEINTIELYKKIIKKQNFNSDFLDSIKMEIHHKNIKYRFIFESLFFKDLFTKIKNFSEEKRNKLLIYSFYKKIHRLKYLLNTSSTIQKLIDEYNYFIKNILNEFKNVDEFFMKAENRMIKNEKIFHLKTDEMIFDKIINNDLKYFILTFINVRGDVHSSFNNIESNIKSNHLSNRLDFLSKLFNMDGEIIKLLSNFINNNNSYSNFSIMPFFEKVFSEKTNRFLLNKFEKEAS